jgi:hypothetical protein
MGNKQQPRRAASAQRDVTVTDSFFVSFLKKMAATTMPAIRRLGINAIEMPHFSWQNVIGCFYDNGFLPGNSQDYNQLNSITTVLFPLCIVMSNFL